MLQTRFPLLGLVSLALLCSGASAQSLSISGTVTDVQTVPVSDVTVSLTTSAAAGRRVLATTDASGKYSFQNLDAGSYQVTFEKAAFESVYRSASLTAGGGSVDVSVVLALAGLVSSVDVIDVAGKTTGSRMEVPGRDLPVQVSSIPQALLQQQGVNDMVTALRNASGVQAQRWYGAYEYYTIRGFNQADVMLVDGMRLEGNRYNTQLNNVESVEVLKGPSSVLYGGSALGGAINIIRKKPQGIRAYDFMYRGGRFNTHQVGGGATGPLGSSSRLLYRLDSSFDYSDGWRKAGARRFNVSPSLTWLLGERARVTVHQAFNKDRYDGDGGVPVTLLNIPGFDLSRRFSTPQDFIRIGDSQTHVLFNFSLSPTWEFRDGFLLRRTSDEYYVSEFVFHDPAANQVGREGLYFHHTRRPTLNQADVVGRFNLGKTHHTLLLGHEYQDFFTRTDVPGGGGVVDLNPISLTNFLETGPAVTNFPVVRETYQANRIHAFYYQDQIDLTKKLKLNVGGRIDDYDRRRHRIFTADPNTITGVQTRNQTAFTYRAGIVYSPQDTHQFYFNTTSAFTPVIDIPPDGSELKPRTGRNYEIGHRWQGFNGRLQTSLALYHLTQNNLTFRETITTVVQAGQQTAKGVDLDINADLSRRTRLSINYGYAQPTFTDFDEFTGNQPRFVQRHSANVWLHKNWISGFITSVGLRYMGPMYTNNENTIRMGGWTTFSGSAGYRKNAWEWTVNAENLLNRARYFMGSDYSDQLYPGAPINVFSTIRLRFN